MLVEVRSRRLERRQKLGRNFCGIDVNGAPETIPWRAVERWRLADVHEHVDGVVPGAASHKPAFGCGIQAPLPHIARHIESSKGAHAAIASHLLRTFALEVTPPGHC